MKTYYLRIFSLLFFLFTFNHLSAQNWALVMSKGTTLNEQIWRTRNHFPKAEIKEFWDQNYAITSLSHFEGVWALVMSKGTGYGLQYWSATTEFPESRIEDYWNRDYRITHLTYGDGKWCVVLTLKSEFQEQIWRTKYEFPEKDIKEFWDKGYYVSSLDYGNGLWALVMSKGSGYEDQAYRTRTEFPKKEIQELWDKGYFVTNLTYGKGLWALVMSKGPSYETQIWRTRNNFPEKEIQEFWDKGYSITGMHHGTRVANEIVTYKKPEFNWNSPINASSKVNKTDYTVKACIKSETPLTKIDLYVNNVLIPEKEEDRGFDIVPADGCDNTIERKIKLNKGNNQIKFVITNKGGTTSSELRNITYQELQIVETKENTNTNTTIKAEKKLALLVGNATYQKSPLKNPVNDARSMEIALKELGFDVMKYENLDQNGLKRAMDDFGQKLKTYQVGLFFYAGHGLQVKGNNYLVPVNANIQEETDVELECVDAGRLLTRMETAGSRVNIVIMDACRDNPFERSWSRSTKGNGLASMDAPIGSIVCYSTAPGKTASDGSGTNGLYTQELLKHLKTPNLTLEEVFKRVRIGVITESNKQQLPWESSSLTGDFYFNRK